MNEEHDLTDNLITHGGWIATAVIGVWGWILKMALARHLDALGKIDARLDTLEQRLATIEGRMFERHSLWEEKGMVPPRLAELIATEEGYAIPNSLPARMFNPGDLRHSPHSFHTADAPDAVGEIDNPTDGWADLVRQLDLYAARGLTVSQAINEWAPPSENDTAQYLAYIVHGLGCGSDTLLSDALKIRGIGVYPDELT